MSDIPDSPSTARKVRSRSGKNPRRKHYHREEHFWELCVSSCLLRGDPVQEAIVNADILSEEWKERFNPELPEDDGEEARSWNTDLTPQQNNRLGELLKELQQQVGEIATPTDQAIQQRNAYALAWDRTVQSYKQLYEIGEEILTAQKAIQRQLSEAGKSGSEDLDKMLSGIREEIHASEARIMEALVQSEDRILKAIKPQKKGVFR